MGCPSFVTSPSFILTIMAVVFLTSTIVGAWFSTASSNSIDFEYNDFTADMADYDTLQTMEAGLDTDTKTTGTQFDGLDKEGLAQKAYIGKQMGAFETEYEGLLDKDGSTISDTKAEKYKSELKSKQGKIQTRLHGKHDAGNIMLGVGVTGTVLTGAAAGIKGVAWNKNRKIKNAYAEASTDEQKSAIVKKHGGDKCKSMKIARPEDSEEIERLLNLRRLAAATPSSLVPSVFSLVILLCLIIAVLVLAGVYLYPLLCDDDKVDFDMYPIDSELGYCPTLAGDIV